MWGAPGPGVRLVCISSAHRTVDLDLDFCLAKVDNTVAQGCSGVVKIGTLQALFFP